MLPDTAACKSSTNYVDDFGGKNLVAVTAVAVTTTAYGQEPDYAALLNKVGHLVKQQAPLASFEELLRPPTERGDTAFSTGAGMRRRDLFVVGKITINLGSSPKSTYYKAKKLGDRGWFVWDAQAWVNIPEGHHLSPVEIGSNIVWFARIRLFW